ncbi:MAG: HDOD domain-containing protein [Lentisphaerota bacterium]
MPMQKDQIFKKLEQIRNLPTLPSILEKLGAAVRDPNSDASRIARIIADDPSMMARILKVVNSSLYGGLEPITSLQLAVARMGMNAINNIALSTSVFSTFSKAQQAEFNREEFWRHCISAGIAVNVLYDKCKPNLMHRYEKDVLHLAGLLHDIGKIIFETYFRAEFLASVQASRERHVPLFQVELELIGADHAQVGAWLGARWKLADDIIETVRWHHEPDNADDSRKELVMLCHGANYICNLVKLGDSGDAVAPAFFRGVWKRLGMETDDLSGVIERIEEEAKHSEVLLAFA